MEDIPSTLEIKSDEGGRNATFIVDDEDHTLGNSLRYVISTNRAVELTGYSVPHPSKRNFNIRIQTNPNADKNAIETLQQGIEDLSSIRAHIQACFEKQVESLMME